MAKKDYLYNLLLQRQQSEIHLHERKRNLGCVFNFHSECQEPKPKGETNSSLLVLLPSSVVDTLSTVRSHLNLIARYQTETAKNYVRLSDDQKYSKVGKQTSV